MQYLYKIAGLHVLCKIPFPVHICRESEEFVCDAEDNKSNDLTVSFQPVECLETPENGGVWDIDRYHIQRNKTWKIYYCPAPHHKPYACVIWDNNERKVIQCRYLRGKEYYLNYSRNLCDIIALDSLLLSHHGLLLHASFIRWHNQGILFSAPSGTGKSTQADLWVRYEEAEIINGDRAGLRRITEGNETIWRAYGLPYAGSSGIYRNESAPVTAVIALRQAKENRIRRLGMTEAVRYLLPEITVHRWDREFTEQVMNLLLELLASVPVYLLECLPDKGAVRLVKHTITKQGGEICD